MTGDDKRHRGPGFGGGVEADGDGAGARPGLGWACDAADIGGGRFPVCADAGAVAEAPVTAEFPDVPASAGGYFSG